MKAMGLAKESWTLSWSRKYLWFFGFFAVAAGGGGGSGSGSSTVGSGAGGGSGAGAGPFGGLFADGAPSWLWPAIAVAVVLAVVGVLLHVLSEAALIEGVRRERGGTRLGIGPGLSYARRFFWKVLGIKVAFGLTLAVTTVLIAGPAIGSALGVLPLWMGVLGTLALAGVGVPALLTLYFLYEYGLRFLVLDGTGVRHAVRETYRFLHGRLADSLRLLGVVVLGRMVGGMAALVLMLPGVIVGAVVYFQAGLVPALVAGALLALPPVVVALGAMGTFVSSMWTLAFLDQRKPLA